MPTPPPAGVVQDAIRRALAEDLGDAGDITTNATIAATATSRAVIAARKAGTIAGLEVARQVFALVGEGVVVADRAADGDRVRPGAVLLELSGSTRAILSGERV
ncbi:MAG: nicotinate-nucleotide diphosphorylase (carboxylating), partial [Alphaproteobacteria bacterium]|nr:nicotinate-nucleotide diphosphorylase (carboxylating) [Alphaproteobacteria bacterium]